jgi:hypothetical protein
MVVRLLSVEGQPARAVLAQTWMGVFLIRLMSDTISAIFLRLRPSADRLGPPGEPPRTTVKETMV